MVSKHVCTNFYLQVHVLDVVSVARYNAIAICTYGGDIGLDISLLEH